MAGRVWSVQGELVGTPYPLVLAIEPRSRSVREIRLGDPADPLLVARLDDYRFLGEAWLPQSIELEIRAPEGPTTVSIALSGVRRLAPGELAESGLVQPPGWRHVDRLPLTLPKDLPSEP